MSDIRALLQSPYAAFEFCVLATLSLLVSAMMIRRGKGFAAGFACTFLTLSGIVAVTLTPGFVDSPGGLKGVTLCLHHFPAQAARMSNIISDELENILNIVLFVPLGLFATMTFRRPVVVVVLSSLLSFVIELIQGEMGSRNCSGADWTQNTLGAMIGALSAIVLTAAIHRMRTVGPVTDPATPAEAADPAGRQ